jgi:hypothetical protein
VRVRTDAVDSTSLHMPSIDLVVGGDVLYNQCHIYVADTTPDSRENWIAALDRLAGLNPKIAVASHKKTGAPDTPGCHRGDKALPARLRPAPGSDIQRPGPLRRHDRAVSRLGQPPGVVDVQVVTR